MINNSKSFVVLSADKAREIANAALARVKAYREREERKYIEGLVAVANRPRWWRALLFGGATPLKPVTYEQMLASEEARTEWAAELPWIRRSCWGTEEVATMMITAASVGEPIYLTLHDLDLVT